MSGWDDPGTARFYEEFDRRHDRYRLANEVLVREAGVVPGQRVLDVGAGLGGTARAALATCAGLDILCFEPAAAMRERGRELVPRARWTATLPDERFDRVLCGASIWLLGPLGEAVPRLARLVAPGGALGFTIPGLYLGHADAPGGGADPLLLRLPALIANGRVPAAGTGNALPDPGPLLRAVGLEPRSWSFEVTLTQQALRDWLKIPPLTDALLRGLDPKQRAAAIDAAYEQADAESWRRERWRGWTASA